MTNEEKPTDQRILDGIMLVYKQNQEILGLLKGVVGESVPTTTHPYPPKTNLKGKDKPWEKWTKKEEPEAEPTPDNEFRL